MALLARVRASPSYLFIKCYLICTLVTLFAARPVSSRLNTNGHWPWEDESGVNTSGPVQAVLSSVSRVTERRESARNRGDTTQEEAEIPLHERRFPFIIPPPQFPLHLPPPVRLDEIPWLQRWRWRWHDLSHLRRLASEYMTDRETYPELDWDAQVRCSPALHPNEQQFIRARQERIAAGALARFLQLPEDEEVHPDDVPLIAIGGSGGGYRAMFGLAGFIRAAASTGLWQCTSWVSGVSGSCWTIAAYYTIANCSTEVLIAHLVAMAHEEAHPMSVHAMDRIVRSSRGLYYLLGPLVQKAEHKSLTCRLMDFYATLVTTYQFLPRPLALMGTEETYKGTAPAASNASVDTGGTRERRPYRPTEGLERSSFQWSKVWERASLAHGDAPLPILTGVRRVWRPRPKRPATEGVDQASVLYGSGYDWYEITPIEIGSRTISAWIPTWAYGRSFENGRSTERTPEVSLSLIVGQCTGAPAGPLTAYITTMLASIPQGTIMSTLLNWVNEFVKMKQWERRWGNPIRAADEPNPFYGHGMDDHVVEMGAASAIASAAAAAVPSAATAAAAGGVPGGIEKINADGSLSRAPASSAQSTPVPPSTDKMPAAAPAVPAVPETPAPAPAPPIAAGLPGLGPVARTDARAYSEQPYDMPTAAISSADAAELAEEHAPADTDADAPGAQRERVWPLGARRHDTSHWENWLDTAEGTPLGHVLARLPKLPEMPRMPDFNIDLRRRLSNSSLDPSDNRYDPESFMATFEGPDHDDDEAAIPVDMANDGTNGPAPAKSQWRWEHARRLRLMDSGLSNNMPNHVLAREERKADVIISFDASSDVKSGAAVARLHDFGSEMGVHIEAHDKELAERIARETAAAEAQPQTEESQAEWEGAADRVREQYEHKYAQRFNGWRVRRSGDVDTARPPDMRMVYCPLLPNAAQAGFDPTTASYSTSYNLIWTADQVRALLRTAMANVGEDSSAINVIRDTVREAYYERKSRRLARERGRM